MEPMYAYAAAALSLIWAIVHLLLGGREVGLPLRQTQGLEPMPRAVAWMCWHYVTAVLFLMPALILLGLRADMPGMIWAVAMIAFSFFVIGIFAARFMGQSFKAMPQGWFFLPVAVLAGLAVI